MVNDFCIYQGDAENAINVLREVAAWCEHSGKNMWKLEDLTRDKLMQGLTTENNFYTGKIKNEIVSSMILQWHDPIFWPQIKQNQSGFIHKLCVKREYSGMGLSKRMIAYAIEECKKKGIYHLRLDTGWHRQKLCQLYESMGFIKVGKKTIGAMDYALYDMVIC